MTPTQRTLAELRKLGYLAAVVEIAGVSALRVSLSRSKIILLDVTDVWALEGLRWTASRQRGEWAVTRPIVGPPRSRERLSRLLMGHPVRQLVDHRNGDTFDNRRINLRVCDHVQNTANTRGRGGSSKFKGVHWHRGAGKWTAAIRHAGYFRHLGLFVDEVAAARAYDDAAAFLFGAFARPNLGDG